MIKNHSNSYPQTELLQITRKEVSHDEKNETFIRTHIMLSDLMSDNSEYHSNG